MKTSRVVTAACQHTGGDPQAGPDQVGSAFRLGLRGRATVGMVTMLILSAIGVLFSGGVAHAGTVTQTGQVFASIGNSNVNVYDPTSGNLLNTLNDGTGELFTAGSAFDANDNFYVADDLNGDISEYNSSGALKPLFASGLSNPLSLAFDSSGNLYVGQQTTPYIAEFNSSGVRQPDIGPLATELYGDDWIALAADQCTIYYTSEGTDVEAYNKCTNTQLPDLNQVPFTGANAFELQVMPNGNVMVADSDSVIELNPDGSVDQTYSCANLPGCGGQLFAVSLDPDGTSFWTGDSYTGNIWQVDIATGDVLQTINTHSGGLYGLSIANQIEVAAAPPVVAADSTSLAVNPVSGDFLTPTPVSAVLTDATTDTPIEGEQVAFSLNGTEGCTGTTDATGTATCVITPGEAASSYTLTASFAGDATTSATPVGSSSSTSSFVVAPDTTQLTYTGATAAVNGQSTTLSGVLTSDTPTAGTPAPGKVVTFTLGGTQTCSGTTDATGTASCTIATTDQPTSPVPVTASFAGDVYDTSASASSSVTVTTPTTLTVTPGTGAYSVSTPVTAVLTTTSGDTPVPNEPVTFTLNGTQTCTAITDATGTATCNVTPYEPSGTYSLSATFGGDTTQEPNLLSTSGPANFVVTPTDSMTSYTGATATVDGTSVTLSGVLTTGTSSSPTPIASQPVVLTLGTGSTAQSCTATTSATGAASCAIATVSQTVGPVPVSITYAGNSYYAPSGASATVTVGAPPPTILPTTLIVNSVTGTYDTPITVSGTLTTSGTALAGQPVVFTVNGTQTCTATTTSTGAASCSITPTEPAGTYTVTGAFAGTSTGNPQYVASNGSNKVVVNLAPTTLTYTGTTAVISGTSATLSATLTTNVPTAGTPVVGKTVSLTLGTGSAAQSCTAVTSSTGLATCTIASVKLTGCMQQSVSTVPVTVTFAGTTYFSSSSATATAIVHNTTSLAVSAATGSDGSPTTVSATLTNSSTSQGVSGEPITLTLNGNQTCTATTNSSGKASCNITPTEAAGTYPLTASFGGDAKAVPQLNSSSGSNNFVVTLAQSALSYTGTTVAVSGTSLTLSSILTTNVPSAGTPLSGRTVVLTLGSGKTAQSCTATTTSTGLASCTIASVNQVAGSVPVTATFAGDSSYLSASTSNCVTMASAPSSGAFVVGNSSAGNPTNGTDVTFYGQNWGKDNSFSGGNADSGLNGYVTSSGGYTCGATWSSSTKSTATPPSTIPGDMLVIVSSKVSESGTTVSGTILHIVVVAVDSGYSASGMCQQAGQGSGKIVETVC
jgi:hypothetical protein